MSDVQPKIDLEALARPEPSLERPRRSRLRIVVPAVILVAFGAIVASSVRDLFRGSIEVTVTRPKSVDGAEHGNATSTVVLQAAGWIEPDPYPIVVTALTSGVVRELVVRESDHVEAGDAIARLFDEEAKLAQAAALAAVDKSTAELERSRAAFAIESDAFEAALGVDEALKVAEAEYGGKLAEQQLRGAAAHGAKARVTIAEEELAVQSELAAQKSAGPRQVELARAKLEEARGALASADADAARAQAEFTGAVARRDRARAEREARFEDRRRLADARGAVALAEAALRESEALRDTAALRLERTTVRAPKSGIVLERSIAVGDSLEPPNATVCTLYDPSSLRVRVDVPQADVAKIAIGADAEVLAESRSQKPYRGKVTRILQRADIQKVTLQVQVSVLDSDELLRPEMLAQVRFHGVRAANGAASDGAARTATLFAPAALLDGDSVWVVDGASGAAAKRKIVRGATDGEWIEIASGLNLSDKLIDSPRGELKEGVRVRIREEH